MIFRANHSLLYCKDNYGIVNDYYQNIVNLIKTILCNNPELYVNVILCGTYNLNNMNGQPINQLECEECLNPNIDRHNKTIMINMNFEHTLVKRDGRGVHCSTPSGNIYDDYNEPYYVRIDNYHVLNCSDIIIDYSNPNIHNVKTCRQYDSFSKKHIYISPSIYTPYFIKENRNITTLTTFINTTEERREKLLKNIDNEKMEHVNINNCFKENEMEEILRTTKILINIHQTPHHDTFEELRALPALECGVIVISEKSPLIETIPYGDLIIWTSYEDIIEKIKEVIINYDFYYNKVFTIENIERISNLKKKNYDVLQNAILERAV